MAAETDGRLGRALERLLVPAAGAAVLVFVTVGIWRPIWLDEAISLSIARDGLGGIAERLRNDNNFPLYYFLLHAWTRLFGDSEPAARLLSGIFYMGGTVAMYAGGRWMGLAKRAALYASFFFLASMQAIHQAQNVRMYALLGFLSALSTVCFCREFASGDGSRWNRILYISVNAAGLLTHLWYPFVLMGQLAAVVLWRGPRRVAVFLVEAAIAAAPFAILWAPSFLIQMHNGATAHDWMPPLNPWLALRAVVDFYGSLPVALAIYALCGLLAFRRRGDHPAGGLARFWTTCAVVSLAVPLAISAFKPIYWPGRYTIITLPPLAFLIGATLSRLANKSVLTALCFAILALDVAEHVRTRDINPETNLPAGSSDKATAQFLLRNAQPGDALIFTSLSRPAVDYYLRREHAESRFVEISFPRENGVHIGWRDATASGQRGAMLRTEAAGVIDRLRESHGRAWVLYGYDPAVSGILKAQLDGSLTPRGTHGEPGPYHTSVLEYSPHD
jgi:mannosyltransferase